MTQMTIGKNMQQKPFLRPFQQRVFDLIMQGKSVILQAPTGAGKTRAALAPFIENLALKQLAKLSPSDQNMAHAGEKLPITCRYAVPMRVLANQFYREYRTLASRIDNEVGSRLAKEFTILGREAISIQTGEQPNDAQLEAALTFCTIDQLLASFLAVPYGMGTNRANLNVGAVVGSYLVLDEFHLYPLLRNEKSVFGARTTAIQMLRLLTSITPFVLMTATFSSSLLAKLAEFLDAKIVTVTDEQEIQEIAQGRTRTFHRSTSPMDSEAILAEHRQREHNKCTLVVCNSVLRAQKLFLQLKKAESQGTRVVLLHSRFSIADRKRISEEVEHELGPKQWDNGAYLGRDIVVIATQVIEVGLDISVQVLHTENTPANSLIQRAGRCARFAQQQGSVVVYPLPTDDEGKEISTLPYDKDICAATWDVLEQVDGREVGFREEQMLIDRVHTEEDRDLLKRYEMNDGEILSRIFKSLNTNESSISSVLIRDVSQVQILIHDDPDTTITEAPWRWQSFSMHPDSLANGKRWEALQERGKELEWICKEAKPSIEDIKDTPDGADGIDNRQKTRYIWDPVTNRELVRKAPIIALPRQLARYDSELGFVLLDGTLDIEPNDYQSTQLPALSPGYERRGSQQTSYQDHISGLVKAYDMSIRDEISYVSHKLEQEMGLPTGMVDQAMRLAIACHDLGKLDQVWQQWAYAWQKLQRERQRRPAYQLPSPDYRFAKTDYDYSLKQKEWQRDVRPKRPRHACESVAIGRPLIARSLGISKTTGQEYIPVLRAICGAIARHHSPQASEYGTVTLDENAKRAAAKALQAAHRGGQWTYDPSLLVTQISQGDDLAPETASQHKLTRPEWESGRAGELETWLYFVLVHALRLADQRAG
jgi:CRISPR-associated endonuclease/helicase Cas3